MLGTLDAMDVLTDTAAGLVGLAAVTLGLLAWAALVTREVRRLRGLVQDHESVCLAHAAEIAALTRARNDHAAQIHAVYELVYDLASGDDEGPLLAEADLGECDPDARGLCPDAN